MNRWVAPLLLTAAHAAPFTLPVLALMPAVALAQQDGVIRDIRVEGTQRIEAGTVLSYMTVKPGDPFDSAQEDASLKNLFATGLFADVTFRRDGNVLVVLVAENPIVNKIAFEGNKKLESNKLTDEIQIKPRTVYTRTRVQADVDRILELYRRAGRYSARVEPKVVVLDQNRVDLVFEIDEGPRTPVSRINFVGNHAYDGDNLRDAILTKEAIWWRFLTSNDSYDPDRLQYDKELLRRFYLSNGFADFRVVSAVAELTPNRQDFFITFTIDEGEKYNFGKVDIRGELKGLDTATLTDYLLTHEGDVYSANKIEDTVVALSQAVTQQHYAFVDVRPEFTKNRDTHTIDITYDVSEGPRIFVERINISGNETTVDEVIRREMKLAEGDAFNQDLLKKSEQNLKDLDYFEKVNVTNIPGSEPDKTIVDVKVTEKSTGEVSVGAGYSGLDGAFAQFNIRQRNLFGEGKDLQFGAQLASYYQQLNIAYTQPYLLGRDIAAGFDIIRNVQNYTQNYSYNQEKTGFDLRAGYALSDSLRQTLTYSLTANQITNIQPGASFFIFEQAGLRYTSQIGQALVFDKRDARIDTTKGYILSLQTNLAGLGGTDHYFQTVAKAGYYYPIADGWVLNARIEAGDVVGLGEKVNIESRFFVGGDNLRGFRVAGIGPRDVTTHDPLGGDYYYTGSLETSIPLGLPQEYGIKMFGFTDFGALGGIEESNQPIVINGVSVLPNPGGIFQSFALRASAGIGVSWKSPFGLVRVNIAYPFLKQSLDKGQVLNFNFGSHF
ncbi:MAG: bamA [Rhodospirillales bacterium]|nr:bamA [Rhodospirillales bacterium]